MKLTKVMAVFGYNNTRIYDLVKIRSLVRARADAEILLVKEGINSDDRKMTPFCFDHKPEDPDLPNSLKHFIQTNKLELIGCLPFSDKGVIGAAFVAKEFSLFGDEETSSFAMLDKFLFRNLEKEIRIAPELYKRPFFIEAFSQTEIQNVYDTKGSFFIKPRSEGNSRGCMKIENQAQLDLWFRENERFLSQGIICEEILSNKNEFSFDGVAGSYWITQKFTTSGPYKAEYQHILPAPLESELYEKVKQILAPILSQLGSRGGAFHHEFFILDDYRIASVEPNRRPAGMWIWDLANWAFEDFDPWSIWIDQCRGMSKKVHLVQKSFAGIRGVIAPCSGTLSKLDKKTLTSTLENEFGAENIRISFLKEEGAILRKEAQDNSDFVAFIALRNPVYETLVAQLKQANQIFVDHIRDHICD